MKRKLFIFLTLAFIFSMLACTKKSIETSLSSNVNNSATIKDGVYNVSTVGNHGDVELAIEFQGGKIINIKVKSHSETPVLSDVAFTEIPKMIIERQSVEVDTVSGATNTSNAIIDGVIVAIGLAGGNVAEFKKSERQNEEMKGRGRR